MKMKKIVASMAAIAMAASAMSISTSAIAEGTVVDFEDGDCSFVYMNTDAGSDPSVLSVVDYDGSKQLFVDVQDGTKNVPKVWFDMDKIMPRELAMTVKQIEFDATFVPENISEDEPVQLGWMGGSVGVAGGFDQANPQASQINPSWSNGDWAATSNACYEDNGIAKEHIVRKMLLPTQMWSAEGTNPFFGFMTWANQNGTKYDIYVDNIIFLDKSGNKINVGIPAAAETEAPAETEAAVTEAPATEAPAETEAPATEAPAETEAVVEEVIEEVVEEVIEEVPAETEAPVVTEAPAVVETAPVADVTTPVTNTGNAAAASILAVMALAGAAAVASKRK